MSLWRRAGGLRGITVAVLVIVALRVIQLGLVALLVKDDESVADRLLLWDGGWFINVAIDGYPSTYTYDATGVMVGNGFAFFPMLPMLIRGVSFVGIPSGEASLLVSGLAGLAAGALIYLLGVAVWSRRIGLILTMLVCAQPMAVSLAMGYTEGLFLALVAGTLLAVHQRIWWLAGLLGVAAALTRPTGITVGLALATAALLLWHEKRAALTSHVAEGRAARAEGSDGRVSAPAESRAGEGRGAALAAHAAEGRAGEGRGAALTSHAASRAGEGRSAALTSHAAEGRAGEGREAVAVGAVATRVGRHAAGEARGGAGRWFVDRGPVTGRELAAAFAAAGATLVAGPLFLAWVGWRVGEWDAWFKVQTAGWGSTFDGGASVVLFLMDTLRGGTGMVEMVTAWLIIAAVALCLVAAFERIWPPLLVFGLAGLVMALGQAGYWHSKPRLLVPVLLLACVPMALALAKAPSRAAAAVLVLWSAFGLWFGAYMITIWPFTI